MIDEDEDEIGARKRALSNRQVLAFVARFWKRRPVLFGFGVSLTLVAIGFDLALPYASKHLVDTVTSKPRGDAGAWSALAMFVGVYFAFAVVRNIAHRFWIPLAARNREEMTNSVRYLFASPIVRAFWESTAGSRHGIYVTGTAEASLAAVADQIWKEYQAVLACAEVSPGDLSQRQGTYPA